MKIVFFTQEDPFYVKIFFDEFLRNFQPLNDIQAVIISRPMGKKSMPQLAKQMLDFYGPVNFIRVGIHYVLKKVLGRAEVKALDPKNPPKAYTVKQLTKAYGLNVFERSDLNSQDFLNFVRQFNADLFISVASPIIFKKDLIEIPKIDCINIHNAPLPFYRGMLPNFWQIYNNEKTAGMTIHRIFRGIDTGDIIRQLSVPIEESGSLNDMIIKTKRIGAQLMIEVINDFKSGEVTYKKITGEGSYFSFPSREDVKEFKNRGKRLL